MFNCKTYYLVHLSYGKFLKNMISQGSYQMKLPFKFNLDLLPGKPTFIMGKDKKWGPNTQWLD
jgi:hypothetical protein